VGGRQYELGQTMREITRGRQYTVQVVWKESSSGVKLPLNANHPENNRIIVVYVKTKRAEKEKGEDTCFECPNCDRAFTSRGGLNKHLSQTHKVKKPEKVRKRRRFTKTETDALQELMRNEENSKVNKNGVKCYDRKKIAKEFLSNRSGQFTEQQVIEKISHEGKKNKRSE
jgi:uncharacterized C2H2 Zn-finger protein